MSRTQRPLLAAGLLAMTVALSACGGAEEAFERGYNAGRSAAPAPTMAPPASAAPTDAAQAAASWVMPDLVGRNLQDAQDELQRVTDYGVSFSTSSDLSGQGRAQALDRNWKVCKQTPPPGTTITSATIPDFGVVRVSEEC
jgi:hypothetical protein